jgi:hypothetical protein
MEYSKFISLLTDTFDSYSFGICFVELVNDFVHSFRSNQVEQSNELIAFLNDSMKLFQVMGKGNIEVRTGDVYHYRDQYKSLLEKHSFMKYFDMVPSPTTKVLTRASKLSFLKLKKKRITLKLK